MQACICENIYIYRYIYIYIYVFTYTYVYIYIYTYTHTYAYTTFLRWRAVDVYGETSTQKKALQPTKLRPYNLNPRHPEYMTVTTNGPFVECFAMFCRTLWRPCQNYYFWLFRRREDDTSNSKKRDQRSNHGF